MEAVGLIAGLALGAVFVASGGLKLSDRVAWRRQARDLGVADGVAVGLPWLELVLGALLVAGAVTPWPAVTALVLLVAFTGFILRRLRDGTRPPCACFGSRSDRPLGARQVVRNVALLAVAIVAIVGA